MGIIFRNSFKHSVRFRHLLAYDNLGLAALWFWRHCKPRLPDHVHFYGNIDFSVLPVAANVQLDDIKA